MWKNDKIRNRVRLSLFLLVIIPFIFSVRLHMVTNNIIKYVYNHRDELIYDYPTSNGGTYINYYVNGELSKEFPNTNNFSYISLERKIVDPFGGQVYDFKIGQVSLIENNNYLQIYYNYHVRRDIIVKYEQITTYSTKLFNLENISSLNDIKEAGELDNEQLVLENIDSVWQDMKVNVFDYLVDKTPYTYKRLGYLFVIYDEWYKGSEKMLTLPEMVIREEKMYILLDK